MNKTELIRLANVMGMDINNEQDKIAVYDALNSVSVPSDFIEWSRARRDTVTYANRREKLTILHTRYKNEVDDIPIDTIESATRLTVGKFKIAIGHLRDNEEKLEGHLEKVIVDSKPYFEETEISRLMAIGTLRKCISAYEVGSLYEELYNVSVKRYLVSKNNASLTDGQKRINKMLKGK